MSLLIFLSSPMDVLKGTERREEFDAYGYFGGVLGSSVSLPRGTG
jgi:hypothetical protein